MAIAILALAGRVHPVDHGPFDALLRAHVSDGLVDYDAFQRAPEFEAYLDALARANPKALPRADRLALWINAYNAYTIHLVNLRGERDSIRNLDKAPGVAIRGPWAEPIARVGSRTYSLDQIEHEVVRPEFKEPRVHFALVCAALGCPALRGEAYDGSRIEAQLADQAEAFLLRSPEKNRVDARAGVVYLSPIFDWYREDFGGSDAEVLRYVARFHPEGDGKRLLLSRSARLVHTGYDWKLNKRAAVPATPYQVFERMLRYAEDGDAVRVRRSLDVLAPVLTEHLDALGSVEREEVLGPLASADRETVLRGVRRLIARDVIVLLRGLGASPPDRARTSVRSASLHWELLARAASQSDPAGAREVEARLRALASAVDSGDLDGAPPLVARIEERLRALF